MNVNQKVVLTEVAYQVRAGFAPPLALVNACRLLDVRAAWWERALREPLKSLVTTLTDDAAVDALMEQWRERIPATNKGRPRKPRNETDGCQIQVVEEEVK
jgi:hypothetical protein